MDLFCFLSVLLEMVSQKWLVLVCMSLCSINADQKWCLCPYVAAFQTFTHLHKSNFAIFHFMTFCLSDHLYCHNLIVVPPSLSALFPLPCTNSPVISDPDTPSCPCVPAISHHLTPAHPHTCSHLRPIRIHSPSPDRHTCFAFPSLPVWYCLLPVSDHV